MYQKDLISVIVPVYNVGKYLPRCLDSIINNTYKNIEILCVNDGSTDDSYEILKEYAKKEDRITVLSQSNGGLSSARNLGLRNAKGEYVTFIDADDFVHSYFFEYLHQAISKHAASMSACNWVKTYEDTADWKNTDYKDSLMTLSDFLSNAHLKNTVWKILFRHIWIENVFFHEDVKCEDNLFNFEVFSKLQNPSIAHVNCSLYAYYQREGSLITKLNEDSFLQLVMEMDECMHRDGQVYNYSVLCTELIKKSLSTRHMFYVLKKKKEIRECDKILKNCLKKNSNIISILFYFFPSLYRLYRIKSDRSLLTFEKNLRERDKV